MASDEWAVSILPRSAEPVARWLATKGRPLNGQLESVPHGRGTVTGSALIDGALATIECRTHAILPGGDHDIVVGDVVALAVEAGVAPSELGDPRTSDPLLYYRRGYRSVQDS